MTLEARIAFIHTQTACMLAELEGMKAENAYRVSCGLSIAYGIESFLKLPENYGLTHNQVATYLS